MFTGAFVTETPQKPRILVTGANGRLGGLLRNAWAGQTGLPFRQVFAARRGPADIRLGDGAASLPACETVVALWGRTSGSSLELAQNADLAEAARSLARQCGAHRVIHFSSAAVYGPGQSMDETRPPAPVNAYGLAKLAMEDRIAQFPADDITHCCLRLANVVGADSLAPALAGPGPVTLDRFENGHGPLRSYICPGDLAAVLAALCALPPTSLPAVLNVAAPEPVGMDDLARAAGRDIHWRAPPASAVRTVTLNTARLAALLPGLALRKSAPEMIADWRRCRGTA